MYLVSSDTTLLGTVPTCGPEQMGQTATSLRYSGVGHDSHEGVGKWYPTGLPHFLVGVVPGSQIRGLRHALSNALMELTVSYQYNHNKRAARSTH